MIELFISIFNIYDIVIINVYVLFSYVSLLCKYLCRDITIHVIVY